LLLVDNKDQEEHKVGDNNVEKEQENARDSNNGDDCNEEQNVDIDDMEKDEETEQNVGDDEVEKDQEKASPEKVNPDPTDKHDVDDDDMDVDNENTSAMWRMLP